MAHGDKISWLSKMDIQLPPGGLRRIFAQYDAIRTEGRDPAPWMPEVVNSEQPGIANSAHPPDAPTQGAPTRDLRPVEGEPKSTAISDATVARPRGKPKAWEAGLKAEQAHHQYQRLMGEKSISDATTTRPRGKPKAWEEGLKEEKANQLMGERLHASHANKLLNDRIAMPSGGVSYKQDEAGLDKAYNDKSTPGTYLDQNTHTLYVKGTVNAQDWWDDFTKVPAWGDLKDSRRYQQANAAYNYFMERGQPIDRVVGHSLGGSVALELQDQKNIDYSRTFGAPVLDLNPLHRGSAERVRHPLDPVSLLDRGAKWGPLMAYPHTYTGFQGYDQIA